jgi:hypothetical protein
VPVPTYRQSELCLDVFIEIMETCHIRRPIAYDYIRKFSFEMGNDFVGRRFFGDVALDFNDTVQRRHGLKIYGNNLRFFFLRMVCVVFPNSNAIN